MGESELDQRTKKDQEGEGEGEDKAKDGDSDEGTPRLFDVRSDHNSNEHWREYNFAEEHVGYEKHHGAWFLCHCNPSIHYRVPVFSYEELHTKVGGLSESSSRWMVIQGTFSYMTQRARFPDIPFSIVLSSKTLPETTS